MRNIKKILFINIILVMFLIVFSSGSFAHPSVRTRSNNKSCSCSCNEIDPSIDPMIVAAVKRILHAPVVKSDVRLRDVELFVHQADRYQFEYDNEVSDSDGTYEGILLSAQLRKVTDAAHKLKRLVDKEAAKFPTCTFLEGTLFYRQIRRIKAEMKMFDSLEKKFDMVCKHAYVDDLNQGDNRAVAVTSNAVPGADAGAG